ncbi:hypothetical protein OIDMADRAFT_53662 [Oidiodendron maius Zn]|uniref:Uncharacterized protein n=1 Tax=Oidiodendron maius (strain Zn) TaxID=913774 RepID=A0A0C3CT20_OIDMZ|nr:hypothetical protein OIDMADRAFT_53662 [Oidiodendron maius Zn]
MGWSPFAAWPASHSAPAIQRQGSSGRETGPRITVGGMEASAILKRGRAPSSPITIITINALKGDGEDDQLAASEGVQSREETIASYLLDVHPDPVGSAPAASEELSNRGWGNDPAVEASAGPDSGWTANPYPNLPGAGGLAGGCGESQALAAAQKAKKLNPPEKNITTSHAKSPSWDPDYL